MSEFKLTLKGDGISVERTIDRNTALSVLTSVFASPEISLTESASVERVPASPIFDRTQVVKPSLLTAAESKTVEPKPLSLREYINNAEPKTNAQMVLLIAQFMYENEAVDRFQRESIRKRFPKAGASMPKNFSRDFQTALDKGWIGEDPSSKETFYVTRTGEAQLKEGFRSRRN